MPAIDGEFVPGPSFPSFDRRSGIPPNAFGLYEMHGNVLHWVQDCFANYSGLPTDGSAYEVAVPLKAAPFPEMNGASSCSFRMLRGGDWGDPPSMIRSAFRNFGPGPGATLQDYRSGGVGFASPERLTSFPPFSLGCILKH